MKNHSEINGCFYEFANFQLLPSERLLLLNENPVPLPPKVFDTLLVLVERGSHLMEKDELLDKIWADAFVEEGTLARNISILRKVLGEGGARKFIETVPKRGYRFIEPVRRLPIEADLEPLPAGVKSVSGTLKKPLPLKTHRPILWLITAFTVVAGIFFSTSFWIAGGGNTSGINSIAVLPFRSVGAEADRDKSLELGMADAVITRLGNFRQIVVRPTSTVSRYLEIESEAIQAGKALKTEAVLEGTIQRNGDRLFVTARLINTADGSSLWAGDFKTEFTDIFSVQDSISSKIADRLNLKLSDGRESLPTRPETANAEAYGLYLKGRYFLSRASPQNLQKAMDHFTQAIVADAGFAGAYAGLADTYAFQVSYTYVSARENLPKARSAAEKALELNANLAEAHASLAHIKWLSWEWNGAEEGFRRALELDPNAWQAQNWHAIFLSSVARHDEAIAAAKRAVELDPTSIPASQNLERAFYLARRYDEALQTSEKTLELSSNANGINSFREMAFEQKGMYDEAVRTRIRGMQTIGIEAEKIETVRKTYGKRGIRAVWQNQLNEMNEKVSKGYVAPYNLARKYAQLGNKQEALAWLQRSQAEHNDHLVMLKVDPIFDPLRSDVRFTALLDQIGLN